MFIQSFPSGPISTNAYIIACEKTLQAVVIDPAPDSFSSIKKLLDEKNFSCVLILLTHSHWDHIQDVCYFKAVYTCPVYVHPLDVLNLRSPGSDGLPLFTKFDGIEPDGLLDENTSYQIGHLNFQVIHTPGHSPGSVCFYEATQHVLISGDTLFQGSIGKISFPTSQPDLMWSSLRRLAQLPETTQVYPGHGPQTSIQREKNLLLNAKEMFS